MGFIWHAAGPTFHKHTGSGIQEIIGVGLFINSMEIA
jgi:hypothetical protein